jgi:hypothetical protein
MSLWGQGPIKHSMESFEAMTWDVWSIEVPLESNFEIALENERRRKLPTLLNTSFPDTNKEVAISFGGGALCVRVTLFSLDVTPSI